MPSAVKLMRNTLEQAGYTVVTASGYEEAVAVSHAERPDLIFIQLMMPDTPMFLEGDLPAAPRPKPERRGCLPFFRRPTIHKEEKTPLDRRLYPEAFVEDLTSVEDLIARAGKGRFPGDSLPIPEYGVPPYPIDTYIRSLQYEPETNIPPVITTMDRAAVLPYWSWEGIVIHGPPFTYLTRPFLPSELLQHARDLLPVPGP